MDNLSKNKRIYSDWYW